MQIVAQNHGGGDFIERSSRASARTGFSGSALGKGLFRVPAAQSLVDQFNGNSQVGSQTLAKSRGFLSHFAAGAIET
jgi:hypothetical protein